MATRIWSRVYWCVFGLFLLASSATPQSVSTSIVNVSGTGTAGGTATLNCTLVDNNSDGIANETITFTLFGNTVGTATTDASGYATLAGVSLTGTLGMFAGNYVGVIEATFNGDSTYFVSTQSGTLVVSSGGGGGGGGGGSAPGTPSIGSISVDSGGNATINFTEASPNGTPTYTASCSTFGGGSIVTNAIGVSSSPIVVGPLTTGNTYSCAVAASNGPGLTAASTTFSVGPPGAPGISFTSSTTTSISGTLTAGASNGAAVTGYAVICGSFSGTVTGTSFTVGGLGAGATYTCSATDSNFFGASTAATAQGSTSGSTPVLPPPSAPTNVSAIPGNGQITVAFTPGSTNGAQILGYRADCEGLNAAGALQGSIFFGSDEAPPTLTPGVATSLTVPNVPNGAAYQCDVQVLFAAGTIETDAANAVVPGPPGAPTITLSGLTAAGFPLPNLSIAFTNNSVANAAAITSNTGTCAPVGTPPAGIGIATASSSGTSPIGIPLALNTIYSCTVTATSSAGTSQPSAALVVGAPTPGITSLTSTKGGQLTLAFTDGTQPIDGAATTYSATCTSGRTTVGPLQATGVAPITFTGLTPGSSYTCTVTAVNSFGQAVSAPMSAIASGQAITTFPLWNGLSVAYPFGAPSSVGWDTFGQTFVLPAGENSISRFSFAVGWNFGDVVSFSGYLMAWNETAGMATGPVLFQSAPVTVDSSTQGIQRVDFPVSNVTLMPGTQYVFFLLASSASGAAATGIFGVTGDNASYAAGNFVFTDSGGTFSSLTSNTWAQTDAASAWGDAVFEVDFSSVPVAGLPGAPTITSVVPAAGGGATVAFNAPAINGASAITSYTITATAVGGAGTVSCTVNVSAVSGPSSGAGLSCTFPASGQNSLVSGTSYTFSVTATNGSGAGPASAPSLPLIPGPPGAPTITSVTEAAPGTPGAVTLTFSATSSGATATAYGVTCTSAANASSVSTTAAALGPITLSGLFRGSLYSCVVSAMNQAGSRASAAVQVGIPPTPVNVQAALVIPAVSGKPQIQVSFTEPVGYPAPTGYTATCSAAGQSSATGSPSSTGGNSIILGVAVGATYSCTVTAANDYGFSSVSSAQSVSTIGAPGPPQNVTATASSDGKSVAISWQAPQSNGGAAVGGYTVQQATGSASPTNVYSGTANAATVQNLQPGKTYTFTVAAQNSAGTGTAVSVQVTTGQQLAVSHNTGASMTVDPAQMFTIPFTASGGAPPYTFTLTSSPAVSSISTLPVTSAGIAVPAFTLAPGVYTIGESVTDSGNQTGSDSIVVYAPGTTSPLTLPSATASSLYTYTFAAEGAANSQYTFTSANLPSGLQLSSAGVLTGTISTQGNVKFSVSVNGLTASVFTLPVLAPAQPQVTSTTLPSGQVNASYAGSLSATGGAPPYTWQLIPQGSLPVGGLSIDSSGAIKGTPGAPCNACQFTAAVTDSNNQTANATFSITVNAAPLTFANPLPNPSGVVALANGIVASYYTSPVFTATGGVAGATSPGYTFTQSGTLPEGLTFQNGRITGTPMAIGSAETNTFTITVTDNQTPPASVSQQFSIEVDAPQPALILSDGQLSLAIQSGQADLPATNLTVSSSVPQALTYSYTISYPASQKTQWLTVMGGSPAAGAAAGVYTTPGALSFGLTAAVSSLTAPQSDNATVQFTCVPPSTCPAETVQVSLQVNQVSPNLSYSPSSLSLTTTDGSTVSGVLTFRYNGPGFATLNLAASAGVLSPSNLNLTSGQMETTTFTSPVISTTGYIPITLTTVVTGTNAGSIPNQDIPITIFAGNSASLSAAPGANTFTMQQGSSPSSNTGSFQLTTSATQPLGWVAAVLNAADTSWLSVTSQDGYSTSTSAGSVGYSINAAAAAQLAQGTYTGTIQIISAQAGNSPIAYQVDLQVTAPGSQAVQRPSPAGLVFTTGSLGSQTVTVYTTSTSTASYQASASTTDGGNWLSVTPSSGSASASSPGVLSIAVNTAGLKPATYTGAVAYLMQGSAVNSVNVTLVLTGADSSDREGHATAGCAPTSLIATQTGLPGGFSVTAGLGTPLSIYLSDNCGNAVNGAQVAASFSNGDPLIQMPGTGLGHYVGTWTPRGTGSNVTATVSAVAAGLTSANASVQGTVLPGPAPVLNVGATLDAVNPRLGAPLAPGSIVQIYGTNLASSTAQANAIPLPTTLAGTSVTIGGVPAPLYYVSAGQINAEVPLELAAGRQYQIQVMNAGGDSTPDVVNIVTAAPGLANMVGRTLATHADGSLVSQAAPAKPGEVVVAYLTGMGATQSPLTDGAASPKGPDSTGELPTVTVGGTNATVFYSGTTPGLVGLYQINFEVPPGAASGDLIMTVTEDGFTSNQTLLSVYQ